MYTHEVIERLTNRTKHGAFSWLARSVLALRPRKRIVRRRRVIVSVRTCYAGRYERARDAPSLQGGWGQIGQGVSYRMQGLVCALRMLRRRVSISSGSAHITRRSSLSRVSGSMSFQESNLKAGQGQQHVAANRRSRSLSMFHHPPASPPWPPRRGFGPPQNPSFAREDDSRFAKMASEACVRPEHVLEQITLVNQHLSVCRS
jgi:hypothetical protein